MKVKVFNNYQSICSKAAMLISKQIIKKPDSALGLPTGSTPITMYEKLVSFYEEGLLDYSEITTFNLDEYYPISPDNPDSFFRYMHKRFFDHVNVPEERVHILDGSTNKPKEECKEYEELIDKYGGLDLTILGIGENGHIAYNEPNSAPGSQTRLVELEEATVNSKLSGEINQALTMGIRTIMQSNQILLLASGKRKAEPITKTIKGPVTTDHPASFLQLHPSVTLYLDTDAAAKLN